MDSDRNRVCTAMMRLGTHMATVFDREMALCGLTQAQFRTLWTLAEAGPEGLAPSELAQRLLLERATISLVTRRMVESGWLERRPGSNRRSYQLVLSPAGQALLEEAGQSASELALRTLDGLTGREVTDLGRLLSRLEDILRGEKR